MFVTYCYFLGLRNLTVIDDAEKQIKRNHPEFSPEQIKENDPKVFAMFSRGATEGVFQFESQGMRNVLMRLKPDCIEDLIAVTSLFRPGPMASIDTYINCRHHPEQVRYKHPLLQQILDVTYGCIVYQEQVMQIFRTLAGYSYGRADIVRRAMSKKKADVMQQEREVFVEGLTDDNGNILIEGCMRRGVDRRTAMAIFDEMESFARYAFNKSHAAAYANVSYRTAWLKCHYPREYMAALLSSELDNQNKLAGYLNDCKNLGIRVLPPHVNYSMLEFSVSGDDIRYGMLAVKNVGRQFIDEIIAERRFGLFKSFYDFCKRLHGRNMNSRAIESMIKCGALDGFGANRRQLLAVCKSVLDDLDYEAKHNLHGQMSFFDMGEEVKATTEPKLPDLPEFPPEELLRMEKEITGMYLSGHPMDDYARFSELVHADHIGDILTDEKRYPDGKPVCIVCIINRVRTQETKNHKMMAFSSGEDRYGMMELIVFPNIYNQAGSLLLQGSAVIIRGRLSYREDEEPKLICESIERARTNAECQNAPASKPQQPQKPPTLYLRIDSLYSDLYRRAKRVTDIFEGSTPVIFYLTDEKKQVRAPSNMWVSLNDVMINELKYQLGESNVVVK